MRRKYPCEVIERRWKTRIETDCFAVKRDCLLPISTHDKREACFVTGVWVFGPQSGDLAKMRQRLLSLSLLRQNERQSPMCFGVAGLKFQNGRQAVRRGIQLSLFFRSDSFLLELLEQIGL